LAGSGKDPEAVHEKRGGKEVAVVVVVFGTAVVAVAVVVVVSVTAIVVVSIRRVVVPFVGGAAVVTEGHVPIKHPAIGVREKYDPELQW
jgi:hypothetical protein